VTAAEISAVRRSCSLCSPVKPLLAEQFFIAEETRIDRSLIPGAILPGIVRGISGLLSGTGHRLDRCTEFGNPGISACGNIGRVDRKIR
jgi:hypothetical protein